MNKSRVFQRSNDVVRRVVAGEVILVPIRARVVDMNAVYALDDVADFIWGQLDGKRTIEQVAERVQMEFDTEGHDVLADVCELIRDWVSVGLVESAHDRIS